MDTQWRISRGSNELYLLFIKGPIENLSCCPAEVIFDFVDVLFCFGAIHCGFEVILFCECYTSLSEVSGSEGKGATYGQEGLFRNSRCCI